MSSNKLTSMAPSPTLSLGPGMSFSLTTSHLSTLTAPPTQPLGASPLATPPTQPLGASPLTAHTLSLSANTLSALNALNNPAQTLSTLSATNQALGQTLSTLNNPGQTLGTLTNSGQTLNTLSTTNQALAALNPSGGTLNTLSAGPSAGGNPTSQAFLASQPMASLVSLPQTFCFPSQSAQSSGSPANQTATLGMTLGFPMAALSSNGVSLNTSSIPLNTSSIPGLSSGAMALSTGQPLSQQLLSLGQQPATALCASLPQNLQIPLGQALLGMSSAAGASAGPFLSTSLGPFSGLPSVIMGGQGMLMGSSSPAGHGPTTAASLQTLGAALNPQSLTFPITTTGPIITELPPTSQPAELAQESTHGGSNLTSETSLPLISSQASQVSSAHEDKEEGSQAVPRQQGSETQPIVVSDTGEESNIPTIQQIPSQSPALPDPQKCQIVNVEQETEQGMEDLPTVSEQQNELSNLSTEQNAKIATQETDKLTTGPEIPAKSPAQTAEKESIAAAAGPQHKELPEESSSLVSASQEMYQPCSEAKDKGVENGSCDSSEVDGEKQAQERDMGDVCMVEDSSESRAATANDTQPLYDSGRVSIACLEDIKQEVMETEDSVSPPPSSNRPAQATVSAASSPLASSPIKLEADMEDMINASPSSLRDLYMGAADIPTSSMQLSVGSELLLSVKQESLEEEEVGLGMGLPDSTPGASEDSQDSYYYYGAESHRHHRLSPSPMTSLRLTRADTTTTTFTTTSSSSTAYNARPPRFDDEGRVDIKIMMPAESTLLEMEEPEFVWEDYLQETGATAVPHTAFRHVECSLQSGLTKGMRVEVANKSQPGTYWVASVVITAGPLLRLRYEGYGEDGSEDFWCDLNTCEIHPIGWCTQNGVALLPPDGLKDKYNDWPAKLQEILKSVPIAPNYLLDKSTGTVPFEQLKQGMRLEVQDEKRPVQVWLARIMENVGGRLYLRLEGVDGGTQDFWAFYLYHRLHPIGWASKRGYPYVPPKVLTEQGHSESEIQHILETALKEAEEQNFPNDIFKDQELIREHRFKRGMKLEAVNPNSGNHIGPATVIEVLDNFYFTVEMDSLEGEQEEGRGGGQGRTRFCCHSTTPTIFPIQWTAFKGIKLTAPPGWPKPDFNWQEYLNHNRAQAAPESCFLLDQEEHQFERGMKLEAVNPENPNQICAATITKIAAHLMWVHLDSSARIVASHVEHVESLNLFPVGWCESNRYQLRPPHRSSFYGGLLRRRVAVVQPEMAECNQESEGRVYCPMIYFNHKCFSGPHLSKGRIAELPRSVGPGPMNLVMKEVLTMLISVAYKSSRVLREIQLDGPPNPAMNQQVLKAKYKSKIYRAVVEICRTTSQLEDFLRQVCIKLECCPNLLSPHNVGDNCPERCSCLTKTKYTYYYGKKKRKIGRPPGGHTNLENGPKKPSKRRKRRRLGMVARKSHPGNEEDKEEQEEEEEEEEEGDDKASETSDSLTADSSYGPVVSRLLDHKPHSTTTAMAAVSKRLKRKYTHHIPPPSEIRTRGAKLPRYSFERRTHKKILLSPVQSSGSSGLRSKSVQNLQMNSTAKFRPAPSPEPSCVLPSPQTHLSFNGGSNTPHHHPYRPTPRSLPPSSLSLGGSALGGSGLSLTSGGLGGSFSLPAPYSPLPLQKNPLHWTVSDTVDFIKTTDCAHVAKLFREQEIDGQALLLLSLPTVQDHLDLKLGPAIKLCHEIQRVKLAYYTQFHTGTSLPNPL